MENDPILKAKQLIEILKYFKNVKDIRLPEGMKCPFNIPDDTPYDGNKIIITHDTLSKVVAGLGYIRWDCPFCGLHAEE